MCESIKRKQKNQASRQPLQVTGARNETISTFENVGLCADRHSDIDCSRSTRQGAGNLSWRHRFHRAAKAPHADSCCRARLLQVSAVNGELGASRQRSAAGPDAVDFHFGGWVFQGNVDPQFIDRILGLDQAAVGCLRHSKSLGSHQANGWIGLWDHCLSTGCQDDSVQLGGVLGVDQVPTHLATAEKLTDVWMDAKERVRGTISQSIRQIP